MESLQRRRGDLLWVALIFLLAIGLRLVYLHDLRNSPLFENPIMDAQFNDAWAQRVAAGAPESEVFFRAPLYPYFLGGVYALLGHDYVAARLVQFLLGALSCVLLFLIARRLAGRTVALIAGLLAAAYGPLIYFEGELLIPVLLIFLLLLVLLSLLDFAARPSLGRALAAGLLTGLAALARPNVLLPALVLWVWIFAVTRSALGMRRAVTFALGYAVALLLAICPATLHNLARSGDLVLISSQGGVNLYVGNHPGANGVWAVVPELGRHYEGTYGGAAAYAEEQEGRELRASEVSGYWARRALSFAGDRPAEWAGLQLRKLLLFWTGQELPNNQDLYFATRFSRLLHGLLWHRLLFFPFGLIGPLGLVGIVLLWRAGRGQRQQGLLPLFLLSYMLSVVPFFVNARFRLPVVPVLILGASYTVVWMIAQLRRGRLADWLPAAVAAGLLLIPANAYLHPSGAQAPTGHNKLGVAFLQKGEPRKAIEEFERALAIQPDYSLARINLASAWMSLGEDRRAITVLEPALQSPTDLDRVHYSLGLAWQRLGDAARAITHFRAATEQNPAHLQAWNNLGSSYVQSADYARAIEAFQRAVVLAPDHPRPHFNLGIARLRAGEFAQAAESFTACIARQPDHAEAQFNLALVWEELGEPDRAVAALREFLRLHPQPDARHAQARERLRALGADP